MQDKTDKMTAQGQALQESISAMVDDQVSEMELRRILKQADTDPKVYQDWERYQLVGSVMRGESVHQNQLLNGIHAALAEDDQQENSVDSGGFWAPFARFTIAASVAALVIMGAQQNWLQDPAAQLDASPAVATVQPKLIQQPIMLNPSQLRTVSLGGKPSIIDRNPAPVLVAAKRAQAVERNPERDEMVRQHLQMLMLEHAANTSANGGRGVLPYARIPRVLQAPEGK